MGRPAGARRATNGARTNVWRSPRRLIIVALLYHLTVTAAIYGLGQSARFPGVVDPNGIAQSFAPDGIKDRLSVIGLSELIKRGQIGEWLTVRSPFHFKLYSICFALFGSWSGFTIISVEPINVFCYLATLVLVFKIAQEVFNRRAALLAAIVVGIWPSFLLHTTQLLRDPLYVAGMLAFILIILRLLLRTFSWPGAILHAAGGGLLAIFLWFTRDNMGEIMIAVAFLGGGLLILRQLLERRFVATNLVGLMLLIVLSVTVSSLLPRYRDPVMPRRYPVSAGPDQKASATSAEPGAPARALPRRWDVAARLVRHREAFFREYPDSTSNIDRDVQLTTSADLLRYSPRAALIGFCAPFPGMWLARGGHVGSGGRLLSGLETLALYAVEGLALLGIWRGRRRLSVWFLALVTVMGVVTLGLVVTNVGALYRLRFIFVILMIVMAAAGIAQVIDWYGKERSHEPLSA